jgi:2-hydroxychromene-2-carboxylate isomerase
MRRLIGEIAVESFRQFFCIASLQLSMGELIYLNDRRADRLRPVRDESPTFFFDLGCPLSYLAAERVERTLGVVRWVPAAAVALPDAGRQPHELEALRERAERGARALRLPLVWPDQFPARVPCALRAAMHACELGAGPRFALAAMRLAFCGGFDLDDPETLAEAAAAAGVPLQECMAAAGESDRDEVLLSTTRGLLRRGIKELPVIRVGRRWFEGEHGLVAASALLREPSAYDHPLAPVC